MKKTRQNCGKLQEGRVYLESWGRWASHGDTTRQIGLAESSLHLGRGTHSGIDTVGIAVDQALSALGDDYKRLAIMIYQHSLPNDEAMTRLGWSRMRFQKHLAAVKVAALVAMALSQPQGLIIAKK